MPSLRVAYFVLPLSLLPKYKEVFSYYSATVPRFDQHILANFMRDGHFSKHLNRMRKIYRKKHDKLISVFSKCYPHVKISGDSAGMHVLLSVPHSLSEKELQAKALTKGLSYSAHYTLYADTTFIRTSYVYFRIWWYSIRKY